MLALPLTAQGQAPVTVVIETSAGVIEVALESARAVSRRVAFCTALLPASVSLSAQAPGGAFIVRPSVTLHYSLP